MSLTPPSSHGSGPVTAEDINSESSSAGEVLTSNGDGTASWAASGGGVAASLNGILNVGAVFVGSQGLGQASPVNSLNDTQLSVVSPLVAIAAMASVCQVIYAAPADVPDISDNIDTSAFLYVTDAAGTNTLSVSGSSSLATPITGNGASIDWTGTSATIVGVDLTWDDGSAIVNSAAGGLYQATLVLTLAPD